MQIAAHRLFRITLSEGQLGWKAIDNNTKLQLAGLSINYQGALSCQYPGQQERAFPLNGQGITKLPECGSLVNLNDMAEPLVFFASL